MNGARSQASIARWRSRSLGVVLGVALCCGLLASGGRAGPLPSVSKAAQRAGPALLRVWPLAGGEGRVGFLVGTHGIAVSVLPGARVGDGVVVERATGERRRARVVARGAAGLAAIEVMPVSDAASGEAESDPWPTLLLGEQQGRIDRAEWLVGVFVRDDGSPVASLGGLRDRGGRGWVLDLPCPVGTPVLDRDGRVIAVTYRSLGTHRVRALPVGRVRSLLEALDENSGDPTAARR